jgi:hypothetical protein
LIEHRCRFGKIVVSGRPPQKRERKVPLPFIYELNREVIHRLFSAILGNVFGCDRTSEHALRIRGVLSCTNAVLIAVANIDSGFAIAHVVSPFPPVKRKHGFASIAIHRCQIVGCRGVAQSGGLPVPTDSLCDVTLNT